MKTYNYTDLNSFSQVKAQKYWIKQAFGLNATYSEMEYIEADDNLIENDDENKFNEKGEIV